MNPIVRAIRGLRGVPIAYAATMLAAMIVALIFLPGRPGSTRSAVAPNPCVPTPFRAQTSFGPPTPTPSRIPSVLPSRPDRSGLVPTPVRVVDLAPNLSPRDKSEILVQHANRSTVAYFAGPADATALRKLLPPEDRIVAVIPPQSLIGSGDPGPTSRLTPTPARTWESVMRLEHVSLANAMVGAVSGQTCREEYVATPTPGVVQVPLDRTDCQNVIASTTDSGKTWRTQEVGAISVGQVQFGDAQVGWAIGQDTQCAGPSCSVTLLRTANGGQNWKIVSVISAHQAKLAVASPIDVWLLTQVPAWENGPSQWEWHVRRSVGGGKTWQDTTTGFAGDTLDVARPTSADGYIVHGPAPGGGAWIKVTHDGGQTWQSLPSPVDPGFGLACRIAFRTATEGWLLALGEPSAGFQPKELFHTLDAGKTWTKLAWTHTWDPKSSAQGLPDYGNILADGAMAFTTARDGWIAMPRGGLLHSTDGGHTWRTVPLGDDTFTDLQFTNPSTGWVGGPGGLWATNDGGKTWRRLTVPAKKGQT